MRILVVDDHELVRRGICAILAAEPGLTICGEAADGQDAVEKTAELNPDLVVMDVTMPRMNGLEATREIKRLFPKTEIVVVSQHEAPEMMRQAFNAGAHAYVMKSVISTDLLTAIAKAGNHESFVRTMGPSGNNPNLNAQKVLQEDAKAEKSLRENEERLRLSQQVGRVGTFEWNVKTGTIHWTAELEAMHGLVPGAFEGTQSAWEQLVHPDDRVEVMRRLKRSMKDGTFEREWRIVWPNKSIHWLLCRAAVFKNQGGESERLIGVNIDVTERKVADQVTSLLASIVDSSDDAIISKTLDGVVSSWNRGAERLFGYSADEAIGRNITFIIPPNRRDEEVEILARIKRGERVEHFETVRVHKDGSSLDISLTISPVKDAAGNVIGASKVARAITERKLVEQTLRQNEERLRTLADDLEEKVGNRTRELEQRNSDVIRQSDQLRELSNRLLQAQDEERRRIARELHDGVGQLLAALSMNLSSVVKEKAKLSPNAARCVDENATLIEQASTEIRTMSHLLHPPLLDEVGLESALGWYTSGFAERSKIDVQTRLVPGFSKGLPRDLALALFRIIQECLTNVHRHSGSANVVVKIERSPTEITLEVMDNGRGIAPDIQTKITSGESYGVGMRGMRERVRQFGGRLAVHSSEAGTRVVATLPIDGTQSVENLPPDEAIIEESRASDGAKQVAHDEVATILCIDDETAGLLPRRLLLESAGHRVIEARSGEEGIQIFQSQKVDAVILDYWMSGMKGTAVASELKRINPGVPIIVLSGMLDLPGEAAGLVDQWLVKGSHRAEQLLDSISTLLERRLV